MQITLGPQYNVGEKPTVILYIYINRHEEVLYFQLVIPPKRFDIFSPRLGDAQKV